jgi:hypothetical protein
MNMSLKSIFGFCFVFLISSCSTSIYQNEGNRIISRCASQSGGIELKKHQCRLSELLGNPILRSDPNYDLMLISSQFSVEIFEQADAGKISVHEARLQRAQLNSKLIELEKQRSSRNIEGQNQALISLGLRMAGGGLGEYRQPKTNLHVYSFLGGRTLTCSTMGIVTTCN